MRRRLRRRPQGVRSTTSEESLARIASTLDELLAWTRLQAIDRAKTALENALPEASQRKLYQASDGASSAKVAQAAGVSDDTVQRTWKRLYRLGLMREDPSQKGRYIRSFDLTDFDLAAAVEKPPRAPRTKATSPQEAVQ